MQSSTREALSRFFSSSARWCFVLMVVLLPVRSRLTLLTRPHLPVYSDYTDFLLFAPDFAMLGTLACWGISLWLSRRPIQLGRSHVWLPLAGLTIVGWLSSITSWDMPLTVYHALRLSLLFALMLFVVNEIRSPMWLALPVAVQVVIQSAVVIGQSWTQHDLGLQWFGEYALDPAWEGVSVLEARGIRFLRGYGLSDHPNILGGCLAFGLVILLAAFLHGKNRWLIALAIIPAVIGLLLTFSRSAWIAFFVASLLLVGSEAVLRRVDSLKRVGVLAIVCAVAISPFVYRDLPYLGGRLNAGDAFSENRVERGSIIERQYLFDTSNAVFVNHAVLGVGLGAAPVALKESYPEFRVNYQPPHFTMLHVSLETGMFGGLFYVLLLLVPMAIFVFNRKEYLSQPAIVTSFALLVAIAVVGLFDYYTWFLVPGRLWQWMAWGLWSAVLTKYDL